MSYAHNQRHQRHTNNQHNGPGPVPARWLYCPRNGTEILFDRFLPFKTPLNVRFAPQMPDTCQFEPEMVFSFVKMHKLKLGLWIDLTNTSRFYDKREVESRGTQYEKLACRGHGETPSAEQTSEFIQLVDRFVTQSPLSIIGVHCTHGFNRTGFLIVSYLVERHDCAVAAALKEFARVRPPGIYKESYIRELFRRYDDEEDAPDAPELPDWCYEEEGAPTAGRKRTFNESFGSGAGAGGSAAGNEDGDGDDEHYNHSNGDQLANAAAADDDDDDEDAVISPTSGTAAAVATSTPIGGDETPLKKRRKQFLNLNATFMAGVNGVQLLTDMDRVAELQELVARLCEFGGRGFPGSQPVSMDLENCALLQRHPYRVSWKADGTRYMMLIRGRGEVYFFDRDHSCFEVENLTFPRRKQMDEHLADTLIDGEMVIDKVNGLTIPRYLVYDIVSFEGQAVGQQPFHPVRFECIDRELIRPRMEAMRLNQIRREREPFSVRRKDFWEVRTARALLGPKFAQTLSHEPDGLIFQPARLPYVCGPCKEVLKWKPAEMNSVDFKLKISEECGIGIVKRKVAFLYVGQHDQPFAKMKCTKELRELNGKIIECKFESNEWKFMRERTDKSFPNSYNTAMAVCHSIKYPVTTDYLLGFIDNHRFDIMPPPAAPPAGQQQQHHNSSTGSTGSTSSSGSASTNSSSQ